jgi:hypothetical protein
VKIAVWMATAWKNMVGWLHTLMTAKAYCSRFNVDVYKYVTSKDITNFTPYSCIYIRHPWRLKRYASVEVGILDVI